MTDKTTRQRVGEIRSPTRVPFLGLEPVVWKPGVYTDRIAGIMGVDGALHSDIVVRGHLACRAGALLLHVAFGGSRDRLAQSWREVRSPWLPFLPGQTEEAGPRITHRFLEALVPVQE